MKQSERNWFRPLWRRALVTAFIAVWCAWEWFWNKDQFWSMITVALLVYAVWTFFITFRSGDDPGSEPPPGGGTP